MEDSLEMGYLLITPEFSYIRMGIKEVRIWYSSMNRRDLIYIDLKADENWFNLYLF